jgi:hypothetical protein
VLIGTRAAPANHDVYPYSIWTFFPNGSEQLGPGFIESMDTMHWLSRRGVHL